MGKKNFTKVVDQDGRPVVDAKVQANVEKSFGNSTDYHTKTDAQAKTFNPVRNRLNRLIQASTANGFKD